MDCVKDGSSLQHQFCCNIYRLYIRGIGFVTCFNNMNKISFVQANKGK